MLNGMQNFIGLAWRQAAKYRLVTKRVRCIQQALLSMIKGNC